ncbi:LamG domain-containing protein [Paraglaciecola sp.]|uniref:LamG domain-containing protein n=1 Tax=Paraglaciecola sp. TaxID=1920173 RepID=UPI0030F418F6
MAKLTTIICCCIATTLLLISRHTVAGQCSALFPDGASTHSAGGTIAFDYNARLIGSDDNLLATTSISKNSGSSVNTCNTADCAATGTSSEAASSISFQTTASTVDVTLGYQGAVVVGSGSYAGNEFNDINPGFASEASITFANTHSEYFVDRLVLGFKNTLYLKAGATYWFNQLTLGSQADIIVQGSGTAIIYVNQSLSFPSPSLINSPSNNNSGDASKLVMYVFSDVTFNNNSTFTGSLYVAGDLIWGSASYAFGAVSAANIQLGSQSTITYQSAEIADTDFGSLCGNNVILNANYHFDELSWSGTEGDVTDSSGNGQNATSFNSLLTNDVSPAIVGNPGTCGYGQFDGVDDYIQLPSSFPDLTGSITITAWINAADLNAGSRIFIDDQNNSQGYGLSLSDGGAGKLRFYSRAVNPQIVDTQNAVISEDDWYFVAAVHDVTAKTIRIYVNGVALVLDNGSTVSTYTGTWGSDAGFASIGGETNSSSETGPNFHFKGAIDETRIYSTALTAAQISTIMSETRTCPIPPAALAEYRFEENSWDGTAGEIFDHSGNGHHARVNNNSKPATASPALTGALGTCGYASQNSGSIQVTGLPLDTLTNGVKTTVTFWMNWDGTNSAMPIGWSGHDIWIVGGSIGFNTGNSDVYGISSAGLANGWHHVAVEFTNGSVTSNRMHIDGVEQVLTQRLGSPTITRAFVDSELRIGGWSTNRDYDFHGLIDEVRVYQGVLPTGQVVAIMNERHSCPIIAIAEYRFDELSWNGTPHEVIDSSGNLNNGTAVGGISTTTGKICNAADIPSNSSASILEAVDTEVDLDAIIGSSGTISLWYKGNSGWNSGTDKRLFDATDGDKYFFAEIGADGRVKFWFEDGSDGDYQKTTVSAFAVGAGVWTHLTFVWDVTSRTVNIFVDGIEQSLSGSDGNTTAFTGYDTLYFGDNRDASYFTGQSSAGGLIDEALVFNTVLTPTQIQTIFTNQDAGNNYDGSARTCPTVPFLLLEYRFEENSWDGTADEIIDYSGNDHHGKVNNNSSPETAAPALSGNLGTCGYASQNNGSIQVTGLPLDTSTTGVKTTVTFWMNWDGTNNTMPIGWNAHDIWIVGGSIGFNTGNSDVYGISSAGLANGWHHVAVEFTNGSVTSNRMHIDGVEQVLTQRHNSPNNSLAFVNSEFRIGGWSTNRGYDFHGLIDEVRIYQGVLPTTQVVTVMNERHPCQAFSHFEIKHNGLGFTCEPKTLTIKACVNEICNKLYDRETSITLAPSGWKGGDTLVFTGEQTTSLNITDERTITLTKISASQDANLRCFNGSTESCDLKFVDAGFEFIGATVNDKTLPDQIAETNFNNVRLRAVQKGEENSENVCKAGLTGNKDITFAYNCDLPASCKTSLAKIDITTNPDGENSRTLNLTFDNEGVASLSSLNYADAGRLRLSAKATINNGNILEGSAMLNVYPDYLQVNVTPAPLISAGAAGNTTITAGKAFEWQISAHGNAGRKLPNYQPGEMKLKVLRTLPTAAGSKNGQFQYEPNKFVASSTDSTIYKNVTLPDFIDGLYSSNAAYYSETGRISLDVQDANYLGHKICTVADCDTASLNDLSLDRFIPAYYLVEEASQPALKNANEDDGFTYVGQTNDFAVNPTLKITAKNALNQTTFNYDSGLATAGGEWLLEPTLNDVNAYIEYLDSSDYAAIGEAKPVKGSAPILKGFGDFNGFVLVTLPNATFTYQKVQADNTMFGPVEPFTASVDIVFNTPFLTDSDGVCYRKLASDANCSNFSFSGQKAAKGADLRFGRFAFKSTYGSEKEPLTAGFAAEYYLNRRWQTNTDDNSTVINFIENNSNTGTLILIPKGDSDIRDLIDPVSSDGSLSHGVPNEIKDFELTAPGKTGEVFLRLNPAADPSGWSLYLNYDWNGDGVICNEVLECPDGPDDNLKPDETDFPQATISFGLFRGNDRVIQWREVFN